MSGGSRGQVNRLLALVPYLQARGEVSVAEAAREFGVSPRTLVRDVEVLVFCGLPGLGMGDLIDVDFDAFQEGQGVIRLSNADYLSRPLRLDSTEAAALLVGLRALLEGSADGEREVVGRTLRKVEAAAGEAAEAAALVDLVAPDPEELTARQRLEGAVRGARQVRITHRSAARDELTTRVVDPVAVSVSEGHAYLDAWCHLVEDRRLFRVDRITAVEVLDAPVADHPALRPLDLSDGIFRPGPDSPTVVLALSPEARWVAEYHPVESVEEGDDGGLVVRMRASDPEWVVRLALRLGGSGRVLESAELARRVRERAREALAAYD